MTASVAEKLRRKSTEIIISTNQADVVDQAEAALAQRGGIYVRARTLVQIVHDVSESQGTTYPTGQPVIVRVGRERLREVCGLSATWIVLRKNKKTEQIEKVETMVPAWVPVTLEQREQWPLLPALDAVSDVPIFRADGTVCETPGYDALSRTFYEPGATKYPPISPRPSHADALAAYAKLAAPFADFPFVAESDKAALIALILTLIARPAIDGTTPMFIPRAPVRGAGKTLLIDGGTTIATGRKAPKRPHTTNEDELRKSMMASALEAPLLVNIDNVDGVLGGPVLAMMLTAGIITDRILGVTETRTVPVRFVLTATGNNLRLRGDLDRRVVPIDIDPRQENPEDRAGFKHPDLLGHLQRARPELVAAALTMLRAYVVAGRPGHDKPTMGSFEAWDRLIRSAVIWASGHDPLGGVKRIRDEGDEDTEKLAALLFAWQDAFNDNARTAAEAVKHAGAGGDFHDAIAAYCRDGKLNAKSLGYALRRHAGRICKGLEFRSEEGRAGTKVWAVRAFNGGDGGNGGDDPATRESDLSPNLLGPETSQPSQPSPPTDLFDSDLIEGARRHASLHGWESDDD